MTLRNLTPEMAERLDLPRERQGRRGVGRGVRQRGGGRRAAARRPGRVSVNGAAVDGTRDFETEIDKAQGRTAWPGCACARQPAINVVTLKFD